MHHIELAAENDWEGFRRLARVQLLRDTPPEQITWHTPQSLTGELFAAGNGASQSGAVPEQQGDALPLHDGHGLPSHDGSALPLHHANASRMPHDPALQMVDDHASQKVHSHALPKRQDRDSVPTPDESDSLSAARASQIRVSREFLGVAQLAALHNDTARFELLYRILWRMQHEPGLRHDVIDPDMMQAQLMARTVRRDMHKMKAFVRFRPIESEDGTPVHMSWFEPEHHIVEATAPFFRDRFTQMMWVIMTPARSARWDGQTLEFGPGAKKEDCPGADAGEALWLTYYRHIFNPARLKMNMMKKEMPRKYWHNLPEAALIGELAGQAQARSADMIAAEATVPRKRFTPVVPVSRMASIGSSASSASIAGAASSASSGSIASSARITSPTRIALHGQLPGSTTSPANDLASRAAHLAHLRECAHQCRNCPIGEYATQAVWGEGPVDARLMIVGEQPGDIEDLRGKPFVGPAGQLFDRAVADLGWDRETLYVTNAVKHFKFEPRGKRRIHKTPSQQEAAACLDWLEQEIDTVRPQRMLALGATAARSLLGRAVVLKDVRGRWLPGVRGVDVLSTWHPAALLRMDPTQQGEAYEQWLQDLALASAA